MVLPRLSRGLTVQAVPVLCLAAFCPVDVRAEGVADRLRAALSAYESGDRAGALTGIDDARRALIAERTDLLAEQLPEPLDGWSRVPLTEELLEPASVGAEYFRDDGLVYYALRISTDAGRIARVSGKVRNASVLGLPVQRVGGVRFVEVRGVLVGLVGPDILVEADGGTPELLHQVLSGIDFRALLNFDQ